MKLELVLNPNTEGYKELMDGIKEELDALPDLEYEEVTAPAPPRTLAIDHNLVQLVLNHKEIVVLATAVVQLARSVIERFGVTSKKKGEPVAVVVVGKRSLKLPASGPTERRFISSLSRPKRNSERKQDAKKRGAGRRAVSKRSGR